MLDRWIGTHTPRRSSLNPAGRTRTTARVIDVAWMGGRSGGAQVGGGAERNTGAALRPEGATQRPSDARSVDRHSYSEAFFTESCGAHANDCAGHRRGVDGGTQRRRASRRRGREKHGGGSAARRGDTAAVRCSIGG